MQGNMHLMTRSLATGYQVEPVCHVPGRRCISSTHQALLSSRRGGGQGTCNTRGRGMRVFEGSTRLWSLSRRLRRTMFTSLVAVGMAVAVGACSSSSPTSGQAGTATASTSGKVGGSLTVWVDSVRLPVAQAYAKAHPN